MQRNTLTPAQFVKQLGFKKKEKMVDGVYIKTYIDQNHRDKADVYRDDAYEDGWEENKEEAVKLAKKRGTNHCEIFTLLDNGNDYKMVIFYKANASTIILNINQHIL